MNFKKHYSLEGKHAFLGASKYHWINYDNDKIADSFLKHPATLKGTILHDFAAQYYARTKITKITKNIKHVCE